MLSWYDDASSAPRSSTPSLHHCAINLATPSSAQCVLTSVRFGGGLVGCRELTREQRQLAEITEMIHTASLVHDDVLDECDLRRGAATVNSKYGTRLAVLAGDYLFAQVCLRSPMHNTTTLSASDLKFIWMLSSHGSQWRPALPREHARASHVYCIHRPPGVVEAKQVYQRARTWSSCEAHAAQPHISSDRHCRLFLQTQSSWFLANLDNLEVIKLISQVIADFANGEISQAASLFDCDVTLETYMDKSFYKTASLIAASCRSAAVFSGMDEEVRRRTTDASRGSDAGTSLAVLVQQQTRRQTGSGGWRSQCNPVPSYTHSAHWLPSPRKGRAQRQAKGFDKLKRKPSQRQEKCLVRVLQCPPPCERLFLQRTCHILDSTLRKAWS
jgi:hypothetical protein